MISPLPTPVPDWIAHYLPTRTPEAIHTAVALAGAEAEGLPLIVALLILLGIGLLIYAAYRSQKS